MEHGRIGEPQQHQVPGKRAGTKDQICTAAGRRQDAERGTSGLAALHAAKCGHYGLRLVR